MSNPPGTTPEPAYTGRARRKKTRLSVRLGDFFSERLITIGGIGTIVAISGVFVFLFFVVAPLFAPARIVVKSDVNQDSIWQGDDQPLRLRINEYGTMGWALWPDGRLDVFRLDTGEILEQLRPLGAANGPKITAVSEVIGRPDVAIGFADGTLRFGQIRFTTEFLELGDVPAEFATLPRDEMAALGNGVVQRTPQGQFRVQRVQTEIKPALNLGDSAVRAIDHMPPDVADNPLADKEYRFTYLLDDGKLRICRASEKENLLTLQKTLQLDRQVDLPAASWTTPQSQASDANANTISDDASVGDYVLMTGRGDNVYVAWRDGRLVRYDTRTPERSAIVEQLNLLPDGATELTACQFLLGRETILCGDDQGNLRAWFRVRQETPPEDSSNAESQQPASASAAPATATASATVAEVGETEPKDAGKAARDQYRLTMVHPLPAYDAAVTSLNSSKRNRMVAVGHADGRLRLYQVTTEQLLLEEQVSENGRPLTHVVVTPKDDGLVATTSNQLWRAELDPGHPEATLASLFGPVWYEGYSEPKHLWQSSFADVGPEMKLGLTPLIFGTLKATFYTMLFGAPLALLAAVYTSEFLPGSLRSAIKPAIEMMASLPSVVLGFLAALVFAPIVERLVPSALACFLTVPLVYLAGAFLWQLIPHRVLLHIHRYRFFFLCPVLLVGLAAAYYLGPVLQQFLFAGDMKRWLDGQIGTGTGAWLLLLLPTSTLVAAALVGLYVNPIMRQLAQRLNRRQFGLLNAAKFFTAAVFTVVLALAGSWLLNTLGWDPRGTYVDTYEQRNALVVGFVMGFAVIPIIYTIADDALTTVPGHLRSASLGCGATAWQTAVRIVIPTAMSGLFSALMIGLGRAVGETMIVLMAGGNTPVTEWNIFNGFRTLSANIAVEMPEAVRDSTHYRTLFLAALTLFLLTFVVNTVAEVVRLRFRRRAYQL